MPQQNSIPGALRASGFFVLRTPLLPFQTLESWSANLQSPQVLDDPTALTSALAADRKLLLERLKVVAQDPIVREALLLASSTFSEAVDRWLDNRDDRRLDRLPLTLLRYLSRMSSRPTPFGLLAGTTVGTVGAQTELKLEPSQAYRSHTRLDMHYLSMLAHTLNKCQQARQRIRYYPNSSLYLTGGKLRFIEASFQEKTFKRIYRRDAVEPSELLLHILAEARSGRTRAQLIRTVSTFEPLASPKEARRYVDRLIENQILESELAPPLTGARPDEAFARLIVKLCPKSLTTTQLSNALQSINELNNQPLGRELNKIREIATMVPPVGATLQISRILQSDLYKPAVEFSLGKPVAETILSGLEVLRRITPSGSRALLDQFREAFESRYGDREVPLVEALDDELGVGFGPRSQGYSPLIAGLDLQKTEDTDASFGSRDRLLLNRLTETLSAGLQEWKLSNSDLEELAESEPAPTFDAFAVVATIAATSTEAANQGDFRILFHGTNGPSGALVLGRFCHGHPQLADQVASHLRAEEALRPGALFAEIVHLPEERLGNIIARPVLRDYEIPYLGKSGAAAERQIEINDLHVSVIGDRIVLRSGRLKKEVIPRLSSAHNYAVSTLNIYRFLGALQHQEPGSNFLWDWGALNDAPFLPRVSWGRVVFALARWTLSGHDLEAFARPNPTERYLAVQHLRQRRKLPRWVILIEGESGLAFDLNNVLCIDSLNQLVKQCSQITFTEMLPAAEEL